MHALIKQIYGDIYYNQVYFKVYIYVIFVMFSMHFKTKCNVLFHVGSGNFSSQKDYENYVSLSSSCTYADLKMHGIVMK
jgi:hypothetical protein